MRQELKRALFAAAGGLLLTGSMIDWREFLPAESPTPQAFAPPADCLPSNCFLLQIQNNPMLAAQLGNTDISALFRNAR